MSFSSQKATICTLNGTHNHSLTNAAALAVKPVSAETKEKIIQQFETGKTPSEITKEMKKSCSDLELADRSINPGYKYVNQ